MRQKTVQTIDKKELLGNKVFSVLSICFGSIKNVHPNNSNANWNILQQFVP